MENFRISAMEFDSIVPVDDLCMAIGLVCSSQHRALRHYTLPDGQELTVNTARNEWAMKNPDCYGNASQLAQKLGLIALTEGDNFSKAFSMVEKLYAERENIPASFNYSPVSRPIWDFTETYHPKDMKLGKMMTRFGISMNIAGLYTLEGSMPQVKGKKSERVLAMSVSDVTESFMAFNGQVFRQIGEPGITTFGTRRKDQICMVYENPSDFLALMEQVERNGVHAVMSRRYHIILNGKRGLREACDYLKANPDFLEVRTFMPQTESGEKYFSAINDAVKGTAIDRSEMFGGYLSLFDKYRPKVPESYRKWKAAQEMKASISETKNVRQKVEKPKLAIKPILGGEKRAVIDRKEGGLKL